MEVKGHLLRNACCSTNLNFATLLDFFSRKTDFLWIFHSLKIEQFFIPDIFWNTIFMTVLFYILIFAVPPPSFSANIAF